MAVQDDGKRPYDGLAITISRMGDGRLRIMIDDLKRGHERDFDRTWLHSSFVTSAVIDETKFKDYSFSHEELEGFANLILGLLKVGLDRRS